MKPHIRRVLDLAGIAIVSFYAIVLAYCIHKLAIVL